MTRPLADRFGRVATDLRVSLTDRCNLRCNYCMPAEGLDWLPDDSVLTDDEVVRLIAIGVHHLGIREVRFTGGEPLLRRGLVDIVDRTAQLRTADGSAPAGVVDLVQSLSFITFFDRLTRGVLEAPAVILFLSTIVLALWINVQVVDAKKAA